MKILIDIPEETYNNFIRNEYYREDVIAIHAALTNGAVVAHQICKVSEYDKDHIWYKGKQYISLRRFLEVKAEISEVKE